MIAGDETLIVEVMLRLNRKLLENYAAQFGPKIRYFANDTSIILVHVPPKVFEDQVFSY